MPVTNESTRERLNRPGAQPQDEGVSYAVWAPDQPTVAVRIRRSDGTVARVVLQPEEDGYHAGTDPAGRAGDRYGFEVTGGAVLPDPVSRFQPEGVHGWSECIDPARYAWRCTGWVRPGWRGQSLYELHVGTFTPEGTFRAAASRLEHVARLGVEAIEIMPVADFAGNRNWGYDGVALYAPARCYGTPDDLRHLVDAAHELGLAVVLDVVYNHLGPDGNYLTRFAQAYFDPHRHTPWGQGFNLRGPHSGPVREYFLGNVAYWLDDFRFDGLRLDATHALGDDSLIDEMAAMAHARGAFAIAEDERNRVTILRGPDESGPGLDAAWADDFHHQIRVALTGVGDGYFQNYSGSAEAMVRTMEQGWFFTGQPYPSWGGRPRGEPGAHLPARRFVYCIENHDQVGNRARGERLEHLIAPAAYRAASALLCLSPYPPLLFMGQEWAAGTPFLFFTDHHGELGRLISAGRRKEFASSGLWGDQVPDPQAASTFERSKLSWDEHRLSPHASVLALYQECLRQRARWLRGAATDRTRWRVASVGDVIVLRYAGADGEPDRVLLAALRGAARVSFAAEPFLQPPRPAQWRVVLDSNSAADAAADEVDPAVIWSGAEHRSVESIVFVAPATILLEAASAGH
jgi:maltooligosyltrehalose trehalohydrolase